MPQFFMNKAWQLTELTPHHAAQLERPGAQNQKDPIPKAPSNTSGRYPAIDEKPADRKGSLSPVVSAPRGPGRVPWPDQISYHPMDSSHAAPSLPKDASDQKSPALDADDDGEWELELDCTPQYCNGALDDSGYDSASDMDYMIDENGIGIIWHVGGEHDGGPAGDAVNNAEDESDFLHVDIFPAEMYFRTMSLRATVAGYTGPHSEDGGGDRRIGLVFQSPVIPPDY